jgi:DUF438 domain-containing protein
MQPLNVSTSQNSMKSKPSTNHVQVWWQHTRRAASRFFDIAENEPANHSPTVMKQLIDELEIVRTAVEMVEYPFEVYHARSYLLASITDLLTGLNRLTAGEESIGKAYIKASGIEIKFLQEEIEELKLA